MPLQSINLAELDAVYEFVEATIPKTGLILHDDALYRPWVRAVVASVPEVAWFYPVQPLSGESIRHLCNFAHSSLVEKGFVLIEAGRVVSVIDVQAVGGLSEPHRLADIVRRAFEFRKRATQGDNGQLHLAQSEGDPYLLLGALASDSDEEIKRKYKTLIMQYHPDRVAHLGPELRDLAAKKTTAINAAYAEIRRRRGF